MNSPYNSKFCPAKIAEAADGQSVLAGLTVEEIGALAARWARLRRQSDPGLDVSQGELEELKKNSGEPPRSGSGGGC